MEEYYGGVGERWGGECRVEMRGGELDRRERGRGERKSNHLNGVTRLSHRPRIQS